MSYRLLKVHWVKYLGEHKVEDLYSYHRSHSDVELFREHFMLEHSRKSDPHHYTIGLKTWEKASGNLFQKVHKSKHGLWEHQQEQQLA